MIVKAQVQSMQLTMREIHWDTLGMDLAEVALPPLRKFLESYHGNDKDLERDIVEMIYGLEQLLEENASDDERAMKGLELSVRAKGELTDEHRALIRDHRADLITLLALRLISSTGYYLKIATSSGKAYVIWQNRTTSRKR